jgi:hypothetical protein
MTGIWRLSQKKSSLLPSSKTENDKDEEGETLLLRLNKDGTFDRYEMSSSSDKIDELHQVLKRGGCWEYQDDMLFLAPERPEDADPSKVHDTLLAGKLNVQVSDCLALEQITTLEEKDKGNTGKDNKNGAGEIDVHLSIAEGNISTGKFMYPRSHKAFFDSPMLFKESSVGRFSAKQILGNLNARLKSERESTKPVAKFHKKDFHGRRFYLTATPHPVHEGYAEQDKRYDENEVLHDVCVLPITFHANNTFTAEGTEKNLRGRYGLTGEQRDRLWFQVSLFGAGRSAPGSVYSEGRLLSHDDRRGYLGNIQDYEQNNQTKMFIQGNFYYGTDLKRAIKPNSMGVFTMQEITKSDADKDEKDITSDEDSSDEWKEDWGGEDAFQ